jgi:hypothetical protein
MGDCLGDLGTKSVFCFENISISLIATFGGRIETAIQLAFD